MNWETGLGTRLGWYISEDITSRHMELDVVCQSLKLLNLA